MKILRNLILIGGIYVIAKAGGCFQGAYTTYKEEGPGPMLEKTVQTTGYLLQKTGKKLQDYEYSAKERSELEKEVEKLQLQLNELNKELGKNPVENEENGAGRYFR